MGVMESKRLSTTENVLLAQVTDFSESRLARFGLTITGLLELVSNALEFLHGLHVGSADSLQDALLLVQPLL